VTAGTATLRQAEAALGRGDLESARREYSELLSSQERDTLLQVAAALYRLGDFPGAMRAFGKVGALRSGEEIFRYYAAVSLYETGQYAAAKKQLACALPYIQTTPETVRYQTKIEGAINLP
jgi:Flp pilus assembly protein TadD